MSKAGVIVIKLTLYYQATTTRSQNQLARFWPTSSKVNDLQIYTDGVLPNQLNQWMLPTAEYYEPHGQHVSKLKCSLQSLHNVKDDRLNWLETTATMTFVKWNKKLSYRRHSVLCRCRSPQPKSII